ncbi:Uncharacterised protein [Mycobacteroides abscessus subsp. abscessus]|nr:Uncharacterised protein [Mycobacteroides abscessus subsp. abscessus]
MAHCRCSCRTGRRSMPRCWCSRPVSGHAMSWPASVDWSWPSAAAYSPTWAVRQVICTSTRSARSPRSKAAATVWSRPGTPRRKSSRTGYWAAVRSSPGPTCPPSSNCWGSTSPALETRTPPPTVRSRSFSMTPPRAPTPSSWFPTMRELCWAASSSVTLVPTAPCGPCSAGSCPRTRPPSSPHRVRRSAWARCPTMRRSARATP